MRKILSKTLCLIGIHNWEIGCCIVRKGKKFISKQFVRHCNWCKKEQQLEKPKDYHPTKYVWVDIN